MFCLEKNCFIGVIILITFKSFKRVLNLRNAFLNANHPRRKDVRDSFNKKFPCKMYFTSIIHLNKCHMLQENAREIYLIFR